jgi:hypothetical protein
MMLYFSYRLAIYSETVVGYNIMRDDCISLDWTSGDVQANTPGHRCIRFDGWDVIYE